MRPYLRPLERKPGVLSLPDLVACLRSTGVFVVVPMPAAGFDCATLAFGSRRVEGLVYAESSRATHYKSMFFVHARDGIHVSFCMHSTRAAATEKTKGLAVDVLAPGSDALARFSRWFAAAARRVADLDPGASEDARFVAGRMALLLSDQGASREHREVVLNPGDGSTLWVPRPCMAYSVPLDITVTRTADGGYKARYRHR